MKRLSVFIVIVLIGCAGQCNAQMNFHTTSTGNAIADEAFAKATDIWAQEFTDDMSLFVDYSFANLSDGVLSTTLNGSITSSYVDFWNAIGNDITSADDTTMFNALPTGTSFSVYINQTSESSGSAFEIPYVDNDGGANNSNVRITSANAKAIGLRNPHATIVDGVVVFSSGYQWDFDPSDGIEEDHLDFIGVALHEIGHTLGFESGVDQLDGNGDGQFSDDQLGFVSALDFLRFSNESELAGADIDWTADQRDKYLSIDGGLMASAPGSAHWSTGLNYGDGEQASHWKDGMNLGAMDPTTDFGLVNSISATDLLAFDVIGYNLVDLSSVPEPGSLVVLALFGGVFLRRRRV